MFHHISNNDIEQLKENNEINLGTTIVINTHMDLKQADNVAHKADK
jgi:hypothetical protein